MTNEMPDQQTEESDESQAVSNLKPNVNIIHPRRERKPPSYLNDYITNVQYVNMKFSLPDHRAVVHLKKKNCKCLGKPLSYIIPWRSGSYTCFSNRSVAKNMVDFGLC